MSKVCINMESDDPNCFGCLKNKSCFVPTEEKKETEPDYFDFTLSDTVPAEWSEDKAEYIVKEVIAQKAYDWIMNHAKPKINYKDNHSVTYVVGVKIEVK